MMLRLWTLNTILAMLFSALWVAAPVLADETVTTQIEYNKFDHWQEMKPSTTEAVKDAPGGISLSASLPQRQWWAQFQDPLLNGYIEEALKANRDLTVADLRVQEARALARYAFGQELPTLSLHSDFNRQRNSKAVVSPNSSQFSGAGPKIFAPGQAYNIYNVPLQASYEVDFLGKNHDKTQSAKKQITVATHEYQAAFLALTAEVTGAYLNLVRVDKLKSLQEELVAAQQEAFRLKESLFKGGLVAYDEVLSAKQNLDQSQISLLDLQNQQALFAHQLSFLRGKIPETVEDVKRTSFESVHLNASVMAGVPSNVVTHRPDILAAEAQLEKARIDVQVARKELFPSLMLTGQYGFASVKLAKLFRWDSYLAAVGGSMAQSLFEGGRKRANLRVHKVRYEAQLHTYQQTILRAFQEVEDSLASLKSHYGQAQQEQEAIALAQENLSLAKNRYEQGINSYLDVISAQQQLIALEQQDVQMKANVLVDTISLYKAIGGGT